MRCMQVEKLSQISGGILHRLMGDDADLENLVPNPPGNFYLLESPMGFLTKVTLETDRPDLEETESPVVETGAFHRGTPARGPGFLHPVSRPVVQSCVSVLYDHLLPPTLSNSNPNGLFTFPSEL